MMISSAAFTKVNIDGATFGIDDAYFIYISCAGGKRPGITFMEQDQVRKNVNRMS